jgi:hypothetical protein
MNAAVLSLKQLAHLATNAYVFVAMEWFRSQGLVEAKDIKYAFATRDEALAAGGALVALVWEQIAAETRAVCSSWGIIPQPGNVPGAALSAGGCVARRPPLLVWKGRKVKCAKQRCQKALAATRAAELVDFAIRTPCTVHDEFKVLHAEARVEWQR